jgi:hypothetical protein
MGTVIPFRATDQWETLRQTRQHIAAAWRLKAESARIRRGYEERRRELEELLAALERRWASGG